MADHPFSDLPAALVEDILKESANRGSRMVKAFNEFATHKATFRQQLLDENLVARDADLTIPHPTPTVCATDGAYAIERLLSTDLVVAVAAAVEGLTPPSEERHWPVPRHLCIVESEPHDADTGTLLRTIMVGMELSLAVEAPHDVVLLDGSFTLPAIFLNQAFSKLKNYRSDEHGKNGAPTFTNACARHLYEHGLNYLKAYHQILTNKRSDRTFVALPKYSTRREVCDKLGWPTTYDDRGILTMLLAGGECTKPLNLLEPPEPWHINTQHIHDPRGEADDLEAAIAQQLKGLHAIYYKPRQEFPAMRLEMTSGAANDHYHLGRVVYAMHYQCPTAAIMEPFPNYLADKNVKALALAMPAFRQIATQEIATSYKGDIAEVYFAMHGYRSESGRK